MILVGMPTRGPIEGKTVADLVALLRQTPEAYFLPAFGVGIADLRISLAKAMRDSDAAALLFVDSDMRFPAFALTRLLSHDHPIVAANCPQRTQRQTTAVKNGQFVQSLAKTGLEEVDSVGTGLMLIRREVVERLPQPWFSNQWDGASNKHLGEDVFFCRKARRFDFKIWIDHDLSNEIRHIGDHEFTHTESSPGITGEIAEKRQNYALET